MNTIAKTTRFASHDEIKAIAKEIVTNIKNVWAEKGVEHMTPDEEIETYEKIIHDANVLVIEHSLENDQKITVFSCFLADKTQVLYEEQSLKPMTAFTFIHETLQLCDNGELVLLDESCEIAYPAKSKKDYQEKYNNSYIPKEWVENK